MRTAAEEPLHYTYLVGQDQPKGHTNDARHQGEPSPEDLEAVSDEAKRGGDAHCNKHHARDGTDAKDEKVSDGPGRISNRSQDQKGDGGRSGETMNDANYQGPQQLIERTLAERAIEFAE